MNNSPENKILLTSKKIYLCGHTGSANRGCEAIVRSTAIILKSCGAGNVSLITSGASDDTRLGLDKVVKLIPHPKKSLCAKGITFLRRKLFGDPVWGARHIYNKIFKKIEKDVILFNIGGDTYCYNRVPSFSFALNDIARERNNPNVFWGCSVDNNVMTDKSFSNDINKYTYITPREEISYNTILKCVDDKKKVYKVCDPAFHLNATETQLPENFKENNTLGLNLSFFVFTEDKTENGIIFRNIVSLIDHVLENTDMNVCLIPHVYNVKEQSHDLAPLGMVYRRYKSSGRISLINQELSCTELKYIISKCRFFIGARTHSTIAAYSTGVPCLAISYSVKSRGIAKDLFGTEEGYALPYENITEETEIRDAFINLFNNEDNIRKRYEAILPEYKKTIVDATAEILSKLCK